jgi:hypothetical protein
VTLLHAAHTYTPIAIVVVLALFALMLAVLYRRARRSR